VAVTSSEARVGLKRRAAASSSVRVTEVFLSLQGEARAAGLPTVFVRLTGCPLRCHYCDTAYAFHGGERQSVDSLLQRIRDHGVADVCVTGGEPLAQPGASLLIRSLCDAGFSVAVETSGVLNIDRADRRASRIMDLKTPASGELKRNDYGNIERLTGHDQVKFVVCDRADFDWACMQIREHGLTDRCPVWLSPSHGQLEAAQLAEWLIDSRLPVRLQLQLHKQLWGNEPGR
jgi:7-carboxy-7-deazaguanine synthase